MSNINIFFMKIAKKIVADEIIAYKVGTQQLLIY
jgi:hypothetical protein